MLCVLSIGGNGEYTVESSQRVPQAKDVDLSQIRLTPSYSGRMLVLSGSSTLSFYSLHDTIQEQDGELRNCLKISLLEDAAHSFPDVSARCVTSRVCLPPPRTRSHCDWVVIGFGDGSLYGFRFDFGDGSVRLNPRDTGRFRQNPHVDAGTAVRLLVPSFKSEVEAHVVLVTCPTGEDQFRPVQHVPLESKMFHSIGEDGVMVRWALGARGWRAHRVPKLPSLSEPARFSAAAPSRLLPDVLVTLDERRSLAAVESSDFPLSARGGG